MAKKDNGNGRIVFTLETPIEWDGETVAEISYRKPKGRDMRKLTNLTSGIKGKAGDATVKMLCDLTEMPERFFDELEAADWTRLSDEVSAFFEDAR